MCLSPRSRDGDDCSEALAGVARQQLEVGVDLVFSYDDSGDCVLQLTLNLYGRRTAGANWRELFSDTLTKVPVVQFARSKHDQCLYVCELTGAVLTHHADDVRAVGPHDVVVKSMEQFKTKFWTQWDDLEDVVVSGSFKKKTKYGGDGLRPRRTRST